ncbi:hypothetical protein [Streptacidiphilus cavernicola]|uniref:Uncharacterized protein n=1 Tax=Streptacidiphilus cavernicola TaxID=3342716 RepID=A0ABV6W462_9ACTN
MPERIYLNRVPGEERIHVEITATETPALLEDLALLQGPVSPAMNVLVCLLDHAEGVFADAIARGEERQS